MDGCEVESGAAKCSQEITDAHNQHQPKDKCQLVYIIFFFIGVGSLLPWNFFITASQYFQFQLRNQSLPSDVDPLLPVYRTPLQTVFSSYLTIASMIPATLANFANLMLKDCLPVYTRLIGSAIMMLIVFIITTAFTKIDIDTNVFFIVTLVTVAINNIGSSINQGSTYGILSVLPGSKARGFLEGQAVAGIIASVANLITIAAASTPRDVGFAYFLIGSCIIAFTIGLFVVLFKNPYFRFYWRTKGTTFENDNLSFDKKLKRTFINLWHAMWQVRWTGFTCLFTFAVTLAVFPSVYILLVPNNFDPMSVWHTKYFHPVIVFLSFNICDYLGRMLVGLFKWPTFEQRRVFLALSLIRAVLVPLTMFCNINSRRIPTVFYHDSIPILLVIFLGLSNGYFISLAVNYAPRYAAPGNEEGCGIATSTYIALGLCLGVTLSYGLVALV